jgi:hypothetical protein
MSTDDNTTPHITQLRAHLFGALQDLRAIGREDKPLDLEQVKARVTVANAIKGMADTLVDTARVEVDYIKATGADRSDFLEPKPTDPELPKPSTLPTPHNPFPVSARHTLGD